MVRKIVWSRNAVVDKFEILDYWIVRTGSKVYSCKLAKAVRETVTNLKRFPEIGRVYQNTELRFIVKYRYLIFNKIQETEVRILHIWDTRRNPEDLHIEDTSKSSQ